MSYPDRSDFSSTEPRSAWYRKRFGADLEVCQLSSRVLLNNLYTRAAEIAEVRRTNFTIEGFGRFDGSAVTEAQTRLATEGEDNLPLAWDATTLFVLEGMLRAEEAPAAVIAKVREDRIAQRITTDTIRAAVWASAYGPTAIYGERIPARGQPREEKPIDRIEVPADAVMPQWAQRFNDFPADAPEADIVAQCARQSDLPVAGFPTWGYVLIGVGVLVVVGTVIAIAVLRGRPRSPALPAGTSPAGLPASASRSR